MRYPVLDDYADFCTVMDILKLRLKTFRCKQAGRLPSQGIIPPFSSFWVRIADLRQQKITDRAQSMLTQ